MTAITVFSTAASFLSFAPVKEIDSMPKVEDFAWGPSVAAIPLLPTVDSEHQYVPHVSDEDDRAYDTVLANYVNLGFENERFRAAYVGFPGRSNFDEVTKSFLERYGEPDKLGLGPDNHHWLGDNLNVRLQYQADTDEGILALTYQGE